MKTISVIIPCYNVENYIDRCLTSLINQTIDQELFEIICVDDASTDHTWEHLKKWEAQYSDMILLVHCEINGRQGSARNIGLSYASGDWIAFIDSDDWVESTFLEHLYLPTTQYSIDVSACFYQRDSSENLSFFNTVSTGKEDRLLLVDTVEKRKHFFNLQSVGYSACAKLIRKEILLVNEISFPEHLAYEDNFWGPLFHFYCTHIYLLEENLYHYYVNSASTVLQKDCDYHTDWLTIQTMKWREWEKRGFLENYRAELEYDFLCSGYLGFLKILSLRYEVPSYSLFQLAREITIERVPDYQSNPYTATVFKEHQALLLKTLQYPISRQDFLALMEAARNIGI